MSPGGKREDKNTVRTLYTLLKYCIPKFNIIIKSQEIFSILLVAYTSVLEIVRDYTNTT